MPASLRVWMIGVACFGLLGCVTTRGGGDGMPPDPDGVDPATVDAVEAAASPAGQAVEPPAVIPTLAAWDALSKEVRQDVLEDDYRLYKNVALTPRQHPEALASPEGRALAERIATYMRANGDMNIEDASHARIGTLNQWVQLLLLDGHTILGATLTFSQQGCDLPDESTKTFKSRTEAEAAGCDLRAGSWSARGSFNHDGVPLAYGDYMEWVGGEGSAP